MKRFAVEYAPEALDQLAVIESYIAEAGSRKLANVLLMKSFPIATLWKVFLSGVQRVTTCC